MREEARGRYRENQRFITFSHRGRKTKKEKGRKVESGREGGRETEVCNNYVTERDREGDRQRGKHIETKRDRER